MAASAEGGTVAEAAASRVKTRARGAQRVADLSGLIGTLLDADLPEATAQVTRALDDRAAVSADVFDLMEALPALAELARYGSVRSSDTEPVLAVVRGLVPRAAAGLVAACQSLDDDAARSAKAHLVAVSGAVALLEDLSLKATWREALRALADQDHVHGRVVGRAVRLLFDDRAIDAEEAGTRLRLALSRASGAGPAAAWIEGFLEEKRHRPDPRAGPARRRRRLAVGPRRNAVHRVAAARAPHLRDAGPGRAEGDRRDPGARRRPRCRKRGGPEGFDAARAAAVLPILRLLLAPATATGNAAGDAA